MLQLQELTGAPPQSERSTGLHHVVILPPTPADLGQMILRLANARIPFGQNEHKIGQSLYLSDPAGNGLEVSRDRSRETWKWENGQVEMVALPLDMRPLIEAAQRSGQFWEVLLVSGSL